MAAITAETREPCTRRYGSGNLDDTRALRRGWGGVGVGLGLDGVAYARGQAADRNRPPHQTSAHSVDKPTETNQPTTHPIPHARTNQPL